MEMLLLQCCVFFMFFNFKCQCHENEPLNGLKRIAMIFAFFFKKHVIFRSFQYLEIKTMGFHPVVVFRGRSAVYPGKWTRKVCHWVQVLEAMDFPSRNMVIFVQRLH